MIQGSKPALIVRNAFAYDFGGAERLAVHTAEEIGQHGYDAVVVSSHEKVLAYARQKSVKTITGWWWSKQDWSGRSLLLFPLYICWQILLLLWYTQLIIRTQARVVHLMSKDDFIAGTLAAKLLGRRVIWSDCADLKHIYINHNVWYKNPVGKLVYIVSRLADHVILVSFSEERLIAADLDRPVPPNYVVLHTAGKDETVTPITRSAEDRNAIIFCATSRLVIAKGIMELVEAFLVLSKESNNYRLWILGDGPDGKLFETRAADNKYIVFLGHQDKPLQYLAASDVYVHPTHHEGFSLSLAEAAMLGKPMIATNVGGNPELVNDNNGILVPVKDAAALSLAMRRLGEDASLRTRMGREARREYVENIDFSKIVESRLLPMYET